MINPAPEHTAHHQTNSPQTLPTRLRRLASLLAVMFLLFVLSACRSSIAETSVKSTASTPATTAASATASVNTAAASATTTAASAATAVASAAMTAASARTTAPANLSLKIGVMPAVDSAPILLAAERGYFQALGLSVDVQIYTNAMNRQSALQSGALDGAMTDVIALVNNVENGFDIKVTTSTDGVFPFLMKGDLAGRTEVTAAMMEVSVTNFLSDRLLGDRFRLKKVYINEIPARLEMISKGTVDLAVIPEPMASQGALTGLVKQVYPNPDACSPDVMVFTGQAIRTKAEALKRFHQAYNKAVDTIAADDGAARDILIAALKLKPEIRASITLPTYSHARVPSEAYLKDVAAWNARVLGKAVTRSYAELVDASFVLP